jgi:hypothetical protein
MEQENITQSKEMTILTVAGGLVQHFINVFQVFSDSYPLISANFRK